jgi:hypothetical protein
MALLRFDLRRRTAARRAVGAIADVSERVDGALLAVEDGALAPRSAARARRCTMPCSATLTGLADLQRSPDDPGEAYDRTLLRLRVARPDGEVECCVRQNVPFAIAAELAPGTGLAALAHDEDPAIAVVDWLEVGRHTGVGLNPIRTARQYAWPKTEEWPAPGAIEVRDGRRHSRRLESRRREWRSATAQIAGAKTRHGITDGREVWTLDLRLDDGTAVTVKDRTPLLAVARLDRLRESATPIAVLVAADGDVAIDWEASLSPGPSR